MKPNGKKSAISRQHREKLIERGHITEDATQDEIDAWRAEHGRMTTSGEAGHIYAVYRAAKMKSDAKQSEIDLMEKEKTVVEVPRVLAALAKNVARVKAMLDAAFRSELPARLGGRPADEIALENGKRLDEIYLELSKPLL